MNARAPARQSRPSAAAVKSARSRPATGTLRYAGASYKISEKQGVWPLLQFARAAEAGFQLTDPRGLAAIHAFLEDVIDPDDWPRFQEDMISKKVVDLDGLMKAAQQAVSDMLDRMTASADKKNGKPAAASEPDGDDPEADGQQELPAGFGG